MHQKNMKKTIGRQEIASFPQFGFNHLEVKIDSGAYTSSIHCKLVEELEDNQVKIIFLDESYPQYDGTEHVVEYIRQVDVKSSNGQVEKRYVILSEIELLGDKYPIYLTVTSRDVMKFPVLLGRKFLSKKFVIDVMLKNQDLPKT
jgi:hypothetical protein